MAATLQAQIDELRNRLAAVQGSLSTRALNSNMNTLNAELTSDLNDIVDRLNALEDCVRELKDNLLGARQELIDLQ